MDVEDKALLRKAKTACKRANRALYYLTFTFPRKKRAAALFLYYYLRRLDDLVDRKGISQATRIKILREHRTRLEALFRGEPVKNMTDRDRALQKFIDYNPATARMIRPQIENLFTTMEFDSKNKSKLIAYKDLINYCYLTGSSPFMITLSLLDPRMDEKTKENVARNLGIGINLTHLLRDFRFDMKSNDVKVTRGEKLRFDIFGPNGINSEGLRAFAKQRVDEAAEFLDAGRKHVMRLSNFKLKFSLSLFRWKYASILTKMKLRNYDLMSDYGKTKPVEYLASVVMLAKDLFAVIGSTVRDIMRKPANWMHSR
ncbi:MAG: squalene/phytoene synthase family protein [Candidatus Aenigmarchaeota archaeon]|nr:squalene/phytoene synthase family protein [Candidatus Aenigmarchaeota archaeon]